MIELIETKNNEFWLIQKKYIQNGNIYGNAVRLTKNIGDDYYFIHGVPIMNIASVISTTPPAINEVLFFDYVRRMGEIPCRKFIIADFGVWHYLKER